MFPLDTSPPPEETREEAPIPGHSVPEAGVELVPNRFLVRLDGYTEECASHAKWMYSRHHCRALLCLEEPGVRVWRTRLTIGMLTAYKRMA